MLKRKRPRPKLNSLDRLFWTTPRHIWSRLTDVLVMVKPETVIGWHRAGFRLYWCWRSGPSGRQAEDILHFNITRHPTADWVVQQLREAFPEASPYR